MSVPHINLTCDKCEATSSTLQLQGHRIYLDEGIEVPLRCTLGWCEDCQTLRPVEQFDDADQIQTEIQDIDEALHHSQSTFIKRMLHQLIPSYQRETVRQLSYLNSTRCVGTTSGSH